MQFSGRLEALFQVPTGGAPVSASNGAQASPQTVTVPANKYWLTAAGNQASLLSTLEQYLNDNVQGYPLSPAAMESVVGGTWTNGAGWVFNEPSGDPAPAFGSPTLTATSLTYGWPGPAGGIDKAIGFSGSSSNASGGDVFDVTATDDIIIAWVGYLSANPAGTRYVISKYTSPAGWIIIIFNTGEIKFAADDGAGMSSWDTGAGVVVPTGAYHVGIACVDRSTGKARIGVRTLDGTTVMSAEAAATAESCANSASLRFGQRSDGGGSACTEFLFSAGYVVTGTGVATGLSANLSTALTNFANAINAQWSVELGSDGRVRIANSFWPSSLAFTNTTLRSLLGFEYDFDYPQTAAQMAAAVGYGTWSAGWLFNIASANDSGAFGGVTMTASSTPTYSNAGPRGGSDKAVGFDSASDAFSGGNNFDAGATDDIALALVAKLGSTAGNADLLGKGFAGTTFYEIYVSSGTLVFRVGDGVDDLSTSVAVSANTWYAIFAVLERATDTFRIGVCPLNGSPTVSTNTNGAAIGSMSNASNFLLGAGGAFGAPTAQVAALYVAKGVGAATGLTSNLSTALSNFATYMKSQTGTKQARSVWYPDCPIFVADSDPRRAPLRSDARTAVTGTGARITHVGVYRRQHRTIRWDQVPIDRISESSATLANASFDTFWSDTQLAHGPVSWFRAGSSLLIVDEGGRVMGEDMQPGGPTEGWAVTNIDAVEPRRNDPGGWTGRWTIEIPELIAKDA